MPEIKKEIIFLTATKFFKERLSLKIRTIEAMKININHEMITNYAISFQLS